jgi:hypothetical protein
MITTDLDRPLDRFDAADDFVPGLLGLLTLLDTLAEGADRTASLPQAAAADDALLVDALLGLLSLRRNLRRWLIPAATAAHAAGHGPQGNGDPTAESAAASGAPDLERDLLR